MNGRDFTRGLDETRLGHECFQRDDAKTADSLSFSGLFGVGVSIAIFLLRVLLLVCFLFSYLAFWAPPFYCNSAWIGTFERCILVREEHGCTIRRKTFGAFTLVSIAFFVPRQH